MAAFWQAFLFILAAEMGDKTQLVALTFATRYPARTVLAAVFAATLLVHLFSVAIGELLGLALPAFWLGLAAGLAFIGFGLWTLRGDTLDESEPKALARFGPFLTVAITFFLAELGDKTMLATITLATREGWFGTWLGSTLGMVAADALAILAGIALGRKLPERFIKYGAAVAFFVFGVVLVLEGSGAL